MSDLCTLKNATQPVSIGLDRGVHEVSGTRGDLALSTTVTRGNQMTSAMISATASFGEIVVPLTLLIWNVTALSRPAVNHFASDFCTR